jgi:hypothetical protein
MLLSIRFRRITFTVSDGEQAVQISLLNPIAVVDRGQDADLAASESS